jgi:hypothetical protein
MSDDNKKQVSGGYTLARSSKFTIEDFRALRELFKDTPLDVYIRLAGIGAAMEGLRIVWLFVRYVFRF